MGREIVYCWKCSQRLQTEDFDRGVAYRYQDKYSCSECVYDLVGDLSAEEQEAVLNPKKSAGRVGTSTRVSPVRPAADSGTAVRRTGPVPQAQPSGERRRGTTQIRRPEGGTTRQTRPIPRPSSSTRSIQRAEAEAAGPGEIGAGEGVAGAPSPRKKILIFAAAGGGGVVGLVVVLILLLGGGKKGRTPGAPKDEGTASAAPAAPAPARTPEQAAAQAMLEAVAYRKTNREDLGGQYLRFKQVLEKGGPDTRYAGEARLEMERIARRVEERVFEMIQENQGLRVEELFGDLLAAWEKERDKYGSPELREPFDRQIESLRTMIQGRFANLKADALDQWRRGNEEGVQAARAKVAKWGLKEYAEQLEQALAAAKPGEAPAEAAARGPAAEPETPAAPAPKPLSPAMKKFLPRWEEAMGQAFGRDYDGASARLLKAVRDLAQEGGEAEGGEIRTEASFDQEAIRAVRALIEETIGKILPALPKGTGVTLEYQHRPGEFRKVTGTVIRANDQRAELEVVEKDKDKEKKFRRFVEFAHLSAASLAEYFTGAGKRTSDDDRRAAALLCLIEGDVEAAKKYGGRAAGKIPERYWAFAKEAREKAPKPSAREFEARDLLHGAELDWRDIRFWGAALDKYRLLKDEYAATGVVRRNQAVIVQRSQMGRDYTFFPADLRAPAGATFRLRRHPKMDPERIEQAWISKEDIDFTLARENYVEAEFYALPGLTYRCWAYVGGCCAETFSVLYQTSEGTAPHPRDRSKRVSLEPGGNFADLVPHGISNLKKDHAAHAPKNSKEPHPKEPSRWEWISIPLPKTYASPGPKAVRLLTDQAGFAVGYILISSTRTGPPNDGETKALAREYRERPAAQRMVGQAEPVEWLVVGPFAGGIKEAHPPESALELDKELPGKSGAVRWKSADAFVRPQGGGKAAFFDLDQLFKPKDDVSSYLLIHVRAPLPMSAQLLLGYDDACKVWLNGAVVHTGEGVKKADEVAVPVKLKEGWNRLLVKVYNKEGQWRFVARLADKDKKSIDELEYHPTGDELVY